MELRGCIALLLLDIFGSLYYQCYAAQRSKGGKQDLLFYEVDGKEELLPLLPDDAPEDVCLEPIIPSNGEMICGKLKSNQRTYTCIVTCNLGYEFPEKVKRGKLLCNLDLGQWTPKLNFPNCEKEIICDPSCKNGGSCVAENVCICTEQYTGVSCQERLCAPPCENGGTCLENNVCSCAPRFDGNRCENDVCKAPPEPRKGKLRCSELIKEPGRFACVADCEAGYHFPSRAKKIKHVCDSATKKWDPAYQFPDCEAECNPPCQNEGYCEKGNKCICTPNFEGDRCEKATCAPPCENGGSCEAGNKCVCPFTFDGDRCEKEKSSQNCAAGWTEYFNTDHPDFSDVGDDESLVRIRESQSVCDGGYIKDVECKAIIGGKFVDYKELDPFGLKCSKNVGFTCNKIIRRKKCEDFAVKFLCDCAACDPPCQNGGSCGAGNTCVCPSTHEGDRCENEKSSETCTAGWTDYYNTDHPDFSDVGDDESLVRIRESQSVCDGGTIMDVECKAIVRGKLVDYKELNALGLRCSKDTGFTCNKLVRKRKCEDFAVRFLCDCATGVTERPPTALQMCPEVPPHVENHCPSSCPRDFACIGFVCVPRDNCPCLKNGTDFAPSKSMWINGRCELCECQIGGRSRCGPFKCPACSPGERSVMDSSCRCNCVACPADTVLCPSRGECLRKELLCNGDVKCPGVEVNCNTEPDPGLEISTNPSNCSTDNKPDTDTCEILGNMFQTFDGYTYQYETCNHVLMKEHFSETFSVAVHKVCPSESSGFCSRYLVMNVDGLVITFGPGIDAVTVKKTRVPVSSLWLVSQKFSQLELKVNGNALVFRSLKHNFDVTWDKRDNVKIKASKCLVNKIVGLCGMYNKNPDDDLRLPNGNLAPGNREFGNSWAIGSREKCWQPKYTPDITKKANETCKKLREKPFNSCFNLALLNRRVQACVAFMLECTQRSVNARTKTLDAADYDKCKCSAYESFVEGCDVRRAQEWRILYDCAPTCPQGMEWQDCGPGCELTCDNYRQRSKICSSTCVPGCYCPSGLVRHQNQCVKPKMCQDCICRGHGDPNYMTFDGRFYSFQGTCTYVLAQHTASEVAINNFQVLSMNLECPEEPKTSCIRGLKILWNGHVIEKQKYRPVYLDQKRLKSEDSPFDKDGISITYIQNKNTLIYIKPINLVIRYFDQMHGFTIELPSFYYYNKTEGLCGVCNFMESDDLYHREGFVTNDIEEFAYSWLEGQETRKNCELERQDVIEPKPGMCNFTGSPCEAILDPLPYSKSCENDVRHSRRPEISMCRSKFQYAQQCCERGVPLDEWLKLNGCDSSCPEGMVYKCASSCPKTCENYMTYREEDCRMMPQNACVCPEGEVLKLGKCVKTAECKGCDAGGHAIGDVWQEGACKTCECLPDLSTKCTLQECPQPPVCGGEEKPLKMKKNADTCCDTYKCVPKSDGRGCEEPNLEECPPGKALVQSYVNACPVYRCECFRQLCPPIVTPFLDDGESFRVVETDCCREVKVRCVPNLCAPPPECNPGFKLSAEKGRCCYKHRCVPEQNVCTYQHQYDVVNGSQVKLPLERYQDRNYQPGSQWHDGLCQKCSCVEMNGRLMSRCKIEVCQKPEDFPDSEKYIRTEVQVPGACCSKYVRKLCVERGVIYKTGDEWTSFGGNSCMKVSRCVLDHNGEAVIEVTSECEIPCTR